MKNFKKTLKVNEKNYEIYSLQALEAQGLGNLSRLPVSLKVLLENLLRCQGETAIEDIKSLCQWKGGQTKAGSEREISFYPARVLMQDFTGVPAVVDLAAMREAMVSLGGDPKKINPLSAVDLVIDHSVNVVHFGSKEAFQENVDIEFQQNKERYAFLRWGQNAFKNFRVVPPGTGIVHQVNLEYLAQVVWTREEDGKTFAFPDTLVGTDSHTTMVNGLAVLGWGVGGIEAEAAMLGQAISMLIPEVVGFRLSGKLPEGATATDLVLTVTQSLRKKGVVGKFVEFYGPGLAQLPLADRATLANMAPEYGATCGFFPIDNETLDYLKLSARPAQQVALVEAYAKEQGMWWDKAAPEPLFNETLELDMSTVVPSLAGPKRPQDRVPLTAVADSFGKGLKTDFQEAHESTPVAVAGENYQLDHGSVVIAAITSCTNTSNPSVMIAAGLVAKKARQLGLLSKGWVKTSLAPGSQVVTDYLLESGLQTYLDQLGFQLVGYGCTTCIGNSGPLPEKISAAIQQKNLVACSVLSGNRNFEGRVNPDVRANYLASPPLVVAYALAGTMKLDLTRDPLGKNAAGKEIFLKDIWPTHQEVKDVLQNSLKKEMFTARYGNVFKGGQEWQAIKTSEGLTYTWDESSTFIKNPPFFEGIKKDFSGKMEDIREARPLLILGDSVTTDHISPAGSIKADSPAGKYLLSHGISKMDFNSYGSRRGNHEVMMRGTFANIRIKNEMVPGKEGGITNFIPSGEVMPVFDAAMKYIQQGTPLVVVAGKEYGTGSSRDWAAKGTRLLGVKAVIVESFERIHRSNLIGMGILPLVFFPGEDRLTLGLKGDETFTITGDSGGVSPKMVLDCQIKRDGKVLKNIKLLCRIDTQDEAEYYKNGGILHSVLRKLADK